MLERTKAGSLLIALALAATGVSAQSFKTDNTLNLDDPSERPAATLEQLDWMVGNWRGQAFGGWVEESWVTPSAGSMLGTFKLHRDGRSMLYEFEMVVEVEHSLEVRLKHYEFDFHGWEERDEYVSFPLVRLTEDAAYFDGLTYRRVGPDRLEVFVSLKQGGEEKEEALVFHRVKERELGECRPVPGLDRYLRPSVALLLGEIHGTAEGPASVADAACLAIQAGLDVTVGLEIPEAEQASIDRFLAGDSARFPAEGFWARAYQDGRSSRAMVELIGRLRELASGPARVDVVAFDGASGGDSRDKAMAKRLRSAINAHPDRFSIALMGNLHNRLAEGRTAYHLKQMGTAADLVSLGLTHSGGSAWICQGGSPSDCGSLSLRGKQGVQYGVELATDPDGPLTGSWHLGPITASPPANQPE